MTVSDHSGIKLEINNRKIAGKSRNPWRLNNTLLNSTQIKEDIPRKFLNTLNEMKIKTQLTKMCGMQ